MTIDPSRFQRYAVYYAPSTGSALHSLGVNLFGWDAHSGVFVDPTSHNTLPKCVTESIEKPKKYGLHGTLKPPFRFRQNVRYQNFRQTLAEAMEDHRSFTLPKFEVTILGSFCALTLVESSPALVALSATSVQAVDDFREPPDAQELERRRAVGLNETQEQNLKLWGYPYVMSEFRFHITLTGRLSPDDLSEAQQALSAYLADALDERHSINDVCIFGEAADGHFHLIERIALSSA